ncbi:MAG TPA: hypothetical protein VGS19_20780 [Streptosporangiaceae bacterium]|nr:hypothetical protein [Streptosporangiaceae bacterium]
MGLFSRNSSSSDSLHATTTRAPWWSAARGTHTARVNGQAIQHGLSRREAQRVADEAARTGTAGKGRLHW